ncbi:hypothetical protein I7Z51_004584 [Vibrio parahaemolyticus]|uniref:hypothetical protein n=2 Tax=Vibrio TaxID=662 RepID=UPI001AD44E95|nr:hypothetical protein [Vibrio parahaemolyticus]EGQ7975602.1 hypothetical protein [Vibrio parahaemolyticus]MBO0211155.1 hypothetical protein [Vibrio sp. Vb0877]MCR9808279.1 hypothetical protein [Vibrio parahaemolyticus]
MLILPFHTKINDKEIFGFSASVASKAFLVLSAFLGFVCLSSAYHSLLYGYSMPNWAIPIFLLSIIPFGYREHIGIDTGKIHLVSQTRIFGLKITENLQVSRFPFTEFKLVDTGAVDHQFYFVIRNLELNKSVFYCKLNPSKKNEIETKVACFLGLK